MKAFNANKVDNYKASCRLEGLTVTKEAFARIYSNDQFTVENAVKAFAHIKVVEAAPHPELHERHEVRPRISDYLRASQEIQGNEWHLTTKN